MMQGPIRILGIDPGLRVTGWGIVETEGSALRHVAHGVIKTEAQAELSERLAVLYHGLVDIMNQYQPDEAAVEETFVNQNPASALKLGLARGVVMVAPASLKLKVSEYSANKVKKAVVGAGHADKDQVAMMVGRLLPHANQAIKDEADALAVAICHAHYRKAQEYLGKTYDRKAYGEY